MDVFQLRRRLVEDYRDYTRSFIKLKDPRIDELVMSALNEGEFWPDPLLQINPTFESGGHLEDLVADGTLHSGCAQIFRARKTTADPHGSPLILHAHQREAIAKAKEGKSYILTSGTGSGKSLTYIVPIVDHILRNGSGRGVQAIIVYPMNALANSQTEALKEFLNVGISPSDPKVTFARYTGQEQDDARERLRRSPPDILLTNYMMLELMLTRAEDRTLVRAAEGLRFLVFDELHTYRGRQGADVAMLIRRCRQAFQATNLTCIGTSATMTTGGSGLDQREEVAKVASTLFGEPFQPDQVIQESLRRTTPEIDLADPSLGRLLQAELHAGTAPPRNPEEFRRHPIASWIESTFGVQREAATGRLIRQTPRSLRGRSDGPRRCAAAELSELTHRSTAECAQILEDFLKVGSQMPLDGSNRFRIFAFRLHQFLTRGDTVWATVESEDARYLSIGKRLASPNDKNHLLFPLVFCRECGEAYYRISRIQTKGCDQLRPREPADSLDNGTVTPGYLYTSALAPWPPGSGSDVASRMPEEMTDAGEVQRKHRADIPQVVFVAPTGDLTSEGMGLPAAFITGDFRFCLNPRCKISYAPTQRSERAKLATLGVDNRSTATTILAVRSLLELLPDPHLPPEAKKLLSFTDNRQDASLQAGHFNDFVHVALLRSALYNALLMRDDVGLRHDEVAAAVESAMNLRFEDYAADPNVVGPARNQTSTFLREVIAYYLYRDLRRDWRVTAPNLEDCGMLSFRYFGLEGQDGLLADEGVWTHGIPASGNSGAGISVPAILSACDAKTRLDICVALLDNLRQNLVIQTEVLHPDRQRELVTRTSPRLLENSPWHLSDERELVKASYAYPRSSNADERGAKDALYFSSRGAFGAFLRRKLRSFAATNAPLTTAEINDCIEFLFLALARYGILTTIRTGTRSSHTAFQIVPSALIWIPGAADARYHDPLRVAQSGSIKSSPNHYFVECYRNFSQVNRALEAREHTAQVSGEDREDREDRFKTGALPVLFCSPTMELGVDIAELNLVNMRNVPPTPANYAQRSGRAGRGGQPALVFTYCAGQSPHDQYFFREPERMVAGSVSPPRLDLRNKDLLTSHIHAIWLQTALPDLGKSLSSVISIDTPADGLNLQLSESIVDTLRHPAYRQQAAKTAKAIINGMADKLTGASWYQETFVDNAIQHIERSFNTACDRWRSLYRSAVHQRDVHHRIIEDRSRTAHERNQSTRLRAHAETQMKILSEPDRIREGDFYSYRYLATEGFLPGYNFPRLPISAYVPGRREQRGHNEFVSRPRFLAISEFGPRSIVYHEGARYCVYKVNLDYEGQGTDQHQGPSTFTMKRCTTCAYAHQSADHQNLEELCKNCGARLHTNSQISRLVHLQNVTLQLRQRISCDEEERMRMGYEIISAYRFPEISGSSDRKDALAQGSGDFRVHLSYSDAADLYRINRGWPRQVAKGEDGFLLDTVRGYWANNADDQSDSDHPDDAANPTNLVRVVPFVKDTKNALVLRVEPQLSPATMAGLEAALKLAIQQRFQLEPRELASEPIPCRDERSQILFYEAAEGGAGVLRQIVDDPQVLPDLARRALRILHYHPETNEDVGAGRCSLACYECLLDYGNQRDHAILDRTLLLHPLREIANSTSTGAGGPGLRHERVDELMRRCDSDLEREFLSLLESLRLRLPTDAQVLVQGFPCRPDFLYREVGVAVFIDGPHHDKLDQQRTDAATDKALGEMGYGVLRFSYKEKAGWEAMVRASPDIFGVPNS
jgi:superfamily II DNA/RNA helicase/very-short-patch-repair endonuclease